MSLQSLICDWSGEIQCSTKKRNDIPKGRCSHAALLLSSHKSGGSWPDTQTMLVFGGSDGATYYEDLHALHFSFSVERAVATPPVTVAKRKLRRNSEQIADAFSWETLNLSNPSKEILGRPYLTMHPTEDSDGQIGAYVFGNPDSVGNANSGEPLQVDRLSCLVAGSRTQWHVDTDICNPSSNACSTGSHIPSAPAARNAHCSSLVNGGFIYLFGGKESHRKTTKTKPRYLGDLWSFDPAKETWAAVSTVGKPPTPRAYSAMTAADQNRRLFLFSGYDGRSQLNDLHCLEVDSSQWSQVGTSGRVPMPRMNCSLTAVGPFLVVFGGRRKATRCNDCYLLDTRSGSWRALHEESGPGKSKAADNVPSMRTAHSAVCVPPQNPEESGIVGHVVFFGGYQGNSKWLNDVHVLTLRHQPSEHPQEALKAAPVARTNAPPTTSTESSRILDRSAVGSTLTRRRSLARQDACFVAATSEDEENQGENQGWQKKTKHIDKKRKSISETPLTKDIRHRKRNTRDLPTTQGLTSVRTSPFGLTGGSSIQARGPTLASKSASFDQSLADGGGHSNTTLRALLLGLEHRLTERLTREVEGLADRETALSVLAVNVEQVKTSLTTELGSVAETVQELKERLSGLSSDLPSLWTESRQISSKISSINEQIVALDPSMRNQGKSLMDAMKSDRNFFVDEIREVSRLINQYKTQAEEAKDRAAQLEAKLGQVEVRATQAEGEAAIAKAELGRIKLEMAHSKDLGEDFKRTEGKMQELVDLVQRRHEESSEDQRAMQKMEAERSKFEEKNRNLEGNVKLLEKRAADLETEISQLLRNNERITMELSQEQSSKQVLVEDYEKIRSELAETNEKYAQLQGKISLFVDGLNKGNS